MIVLSEASPKLPPSASANDIRKVTQTAELLGIQVYYIPQDFSEVTINEALEYVPLFEKPETAFWVGYVPSPAHYQAVYNELVSKNIHLVNSPAQFQRAEEFDKYYPRIAHLTCKSQATTTFEQARQAALEIGYPVFVKGTVQSFKKWGWTSCVAENETALKKLFANLSQNTACSLGTVILRELVSLRYNHKTGTGFPKAREFRVFLLHNQVLAYSYYWDGDSLLEKLTPDEEVIVLTLAQEASQKIDVPYIAIDIGQKESGEWLVIEAGDAQFSGICQLSPINLWQRVAELIPLHA